VELRHRLRITQLSRRHERKKRKLVSARANPINRESSGGLWRRILAGREDQLFLILTLVIGAVVGMIEWPSFF
jgi:hypothetical protein